MPHNPRFADMRLTGLDLLALLGYLAKPVEATLLFDCCHIAPCMVWRFDPCPYLHISRPVDGVKNALNLKYE